jgi:hypothetical protein
MASVKDGSGAPEAAHQDWSLFRDGPDARASVVAIGLLGTSIRSAIPIFPAAPRKAL